MKIKTISHLGFYVKDMERSLKFYCEGLGMKKKFSMNYGHMAAHLLEENRKKKFQDTSAAAFIQLCQERSEEPWFTYLEIASDQFLELFYVYDDMEDGVCRNNRIGYNHLSLEVEDIQKAVEELQKKGIMPKSPINLGPDHTYQCWFEDPDGNQIELMEYTEKSLQVVSS